MRSRNIKPGFFKNESLAECEPLTRILFAGLWCVADRDGRFEWRPKRIKAEVLPYDNGEITVMLRRLVDIGVLVHYQVDGIEYGQVVNFRKHQSPHHTEKASDIPPLEDNYSLTVSSPLKDGGNPPDSLIPDSLIPDSIKARSSKEYNREDMYSDEFETFWKAYPKRSGSKKAAFTEWRKLNGQMPELKTILDAITDQVNWRQNADSGEFRPEWKDAERWIKGRMWEAELTYTTDTKEVWE